LYGGTLQVCVDIRKWKRKLPTLKNGEVVNDLGKYMTELLENKKTFRYHLIHLLTRWNYSGWWWWWIFSCVFGECKIYSYCQRYIDMLKNKIIPDLSNGVLFNLNLKWANLDYNTSEPTMNNKVINKSDVTQLDKQDKNIVSRKFWHAFNGQWIRNRC
jgi:hypothetical protein